MRTVAKVAGGLALIAMLAAPKGLAAQASITVTLSISGRTLGPDTVVAAAVPGAGGGRGQADARQRVGAGAGAKRQDDEVLLTVHPGRGADELAKLATRTANGRPSGGSCDLVFRDGAGAVFRTEHLTGCFVRRVETAGGMRRVSLGYTAISIQSPVPGGTAHDE
ncbi:MAG TPA: hypothetical protein VMV51_10235 [Gemmatimonadaceae bacterium]|nr:hypothetical protein [Gemmatimonadaceae bacterium]